MRSVPGIAADLLRLLVSPAARAWHGCRLPARRRDLLADDELVRAPTAIALRSKQPC